MFVVFANVEYGLSVCLSVFPSFYPQIFIFRLHDGEMVSMDVVRNCPKRKINHEPESPPVIVPRTGAASLKTINEFSQRSKVQFTLPSSPEKVNVQKTKVNVLDSKVSDAASKVNKLHANNMTSENDVIKCPLSSLQKALKSSVNGGKILHSLKSNTNLTSRSTGVDTRSTKNGIEYSYVFST